MALRRSRRILLLQTARRRVNTRTHSCPDRFQAETPHLCSLDQQNRKEEMFGNGGDGQRDERSPPAERPDSNGDDDAESGGQGRGVRDERRGRGGKMGTGRRRGAAGVGLWLGCWAPGTSADA